MFVRADERRLGRDREYCALAAFRAPTLSTDSREKGTDQIGSQSFRSRARRTIF